MGFLGWVTCSQPIFTAGDILPADGFLFESSNLRCALTPACLCPFHWSSWVACQIPSEPVSQCLCRLDESHLTGEADDVLKDAETAPVLFSGSRVLEGLGRCLVIAVGPNSAQGRISGMVAGVETSGDELRCSRTC